VSFVVFFVGYEYDICIKCIYIYNIFFVYMTSMFYIHIYIIDLFVVQYQYMYAYIYTP